MTGSAGGQAPVPAEPGDRLVSAAEMVRAVEARAGGLVGDEPAQLFGAVESATIGTDAGTVWMPVERVEDLTAVVLAGRRGGCPFCHQPLAVHTVTVSPDEVGIWCEGSAEPRPAAVWLCGPVRHSPISVLGAIVWWVGVPGISLGLLSWLPALVAGLLRRRRSWLLGAATLGALTALEVVILGAEPETTGDEVTASAWLVLGLWLGSMVYGGFQVKPWLASRPVPALQPRSAPAAPVGRAPDPTAVTSGPEVDPAAPATLGWVDPAKVEGSDQEYQRQARQWQVEQDRRDYAVWCAEVLLTGGTPPDTAANAPIVLRAGEVLLWSGPGQLIEPRRAPGQYLGGSSGGSVPVGYGGQATIGSHRGSYQPGPELQTPVDGGTVAVTGHRVVFAGGVKTREWMLDKLIQIQQSADSAVTLLPVSNRETVSGVHIQADQDRFGIALDIAASAQSGGLAELLADLRLHREQHLGQRPHPPRTPGTS